DGGDLSQDLTLALSQLQSGQANNAVPVLLEVWQRCSAFYEAALAAISLTFPLSKTQRTQEGLDELQSRVLRTLLGNEGIWRFCGDTAPLLAPRGLPSDREAMRSFLGWLADGED